MAKATLCQRLRSPTGARGQWTREENRTKSYYLGNKKTIVRRKSSLSTFPPCLPSPALTDNIKNLPLSAAAPPLFPVT